MADFKITMQDIDRGGQVTYELLGRLASGDEPTTGAAAYLQALAQEVRNTRAAKAADKERVIRAIHDAVSSVVGGVIREHGSARIGHYCVETIAARAAETLTSPSPGPDKERTSEVIRQSAYDKLKLVAVGTFVDRWSVAQDIAASAAEQLAGATRLPERKEWDCEAYDRGDPTDTADYVDGWNEALDALEQVTGLTAHEPTGCPVHYGEIHGGEAEELRKGIENFISNTPRVGDARKLQALLDRVDARDSLAHLECAKLDADEIAQLDHHIRNYQAVATQSCHLIGRLLAPRRSKT